jgi:L-alanine-DL-glutamate epimerase-like enolase superfamily enzyme
LKITSIETYARGPLLAVVRVRTDDGHEGWGQTAPYYADMSVAMLHSYVAPFFIGKDPWDWDALVDAFTRKTHKVYGSILWRALCGIDTAVYDLLGKAVGRPVYQLLGGAVRTSVPVYGSSMSRTITPEDEAERMIGLRDSHGFEAFKVRIGNVMGRDSEPVPGRSKKIISTVRNALGPEAIIHADANGGYSAPEAIRIGRMLEEHGYGHFEEPCDYTDIESTAEVARVLDIPIAGGEQDSLLPQFHRIIQSRAVDIIQPDIGYVGGLSRAKKIAQMAEAAGLTTTPHCANPSLLQVFTLHLAASQPSATGYQEWGLGEFPYLQDIYGPVPEVRGGQVALSPAPGWGIEILPEFLAKAERALTDKASTR